MANRVPDFSYENDLWKVGKKLIGGIDEVGRGAFAGPLVAACVVFKNNQKIDVLINDSKKLTQNERERASIWIKENAYYWGIGEVSAKEIDKKGIVKATQKAMRNAIKNCKIKLDFILIDAFYIPHTRGLSRINQKPIIKGDSKSVSIAAASIIAKVHRDSLMTELSKHKDYKAYMWNKNKGYGTKEHRSKILTIGKSRLHRVSFLLKLS